MGGSSLTAVSSVGIENGTEDKIKAGKMVYSNHMEAVFQMKKGPYCISLAKGFAKMELHPGQMQITEVHNFNDKDATSYIIEKKFCTGRSGRRSGRSKSSNRGGPRNR